MKDAKKRLTEYIFYLQLLMCVFYFYEYTRTVIYVQGTDSPMKWS